MVNQPKILSFIFISLFLIPGLLKSQESENRTETNQKIQVQGITLGVNLEGPIGRFLILTDLPFRR